MLKALALEDMCAKQEHLIALTKIKHFSPTQAVFKKLNEFPEPAISTEGPSLVIVGLGQILPGVPTEAA